MPELTISHLECFMHHFDLYIIGTKIDPALQHDFDRLLTELVVRTQLESLSKDHQIYKKFKERCLDQVINLTQTMVTSGYLCQTDAISTAKKTTNFDQAWKAFVESLREVPSHGFAQQETLSSASRGSRVPEKSHVLGKDNLKVKECATEHNTSRLTFTKDIQLPHKQA